jgi:hypothetical protein
MVNKGSNNWLWWSIGGIATLGLGLGIYYYLQGKKEDEQKKNDQTNDTKPTSTPTTTPTPSPTSTPSPTPAPTYEPKPTPFTSVEQSNAFRMWVNAKYPAFAKEIDLTASVSSASSMNNATIQKAWGKYGEQFYTTNALALGIATQLATGAKAINGGIQWQSTNAVPRGEITMYTDGKITANAVNAEGAQTKFVQGGWHINGLTFHLMIGGANYSVGLLGLQNEFWNILKKAGIYNVSTNGYSAFSATNMSAPKFGLVTDGTAIQDEML